MRGGRPFKAVGRPRLTRGPRDVVVRIGSENLLWGYRRIVGELKKLGLHAGANSVRRILDDAGIHPSPERRRKQPALPWATFVRVHMESMVACDFFTKTVFTLRGPRKAYELIFIHLGSQRVFCSAPTYSPDAAWVSSSPSGPFSMERSCQREKVVGGMPIWVRVRRSGRWDCSKMRMISSFSDAGYLMRARPQPRSRFF
jgi:hypothetical protein